MNARRRITAALIALLVLVAGAWLVQQLASDSTGMQPVVEVGE